MTLRDNNLTRCLLLSAVFIASSLASAQGLFGPIQAGDTAAFTAALQAGANINATDEYGQTPLMYAVTFNQSDMVEALIAAGADVNVRTLAGWTALHYAARDATDNRIIDALLNAGADPDARNHDGQTPHAIATASGTDSASGALEAAATLTPTVTGTEPGALPPSESRQWVTIIGTGFGRNAVVTFSSSGTDYRIPVERTEYVDSRAIRVFAGLFPADSSWTVRVTNPNGLGSNTQSIRFEALRDAEQLASAPTAATTERPPTWPRLLGARWTGPQAILDHPMCAQAGCRYLRAEPFEFQGTLRFTTHILSTREPPGLTLEVVVFGPSSNTPNRIAILGIRISDASRYPVRSASSFIADIAWVESQGATVIDAADLCVDAADYRDAAGTMTMLRRFTGFSVNCAYTRVNPLTGHRLPSPTFMLDLVAPD